MIQSNLPFSDNLDFMMQISQPAWEGHGEDSFCGAIRENAALTAVFDGCGGLGSRLYETFQGHSGAYISSRLASGAVFDWFRQYWGMPFCSAEQLTGSMDSYIRAAFQKALPYTSGGLAMRGSMVRDLPCTAAIAFVENTPGGILLHVIWAGDSRVYMIDEQGLAQLTVDDIEGEDAMSNLQNDGALTNVLSSDGKYHLNYRCLRVDHPMLIFSATDGCFGYYTTPMQFEYKVLEDLLQSAVVSEYENRLKASICDVAGDDMALGLLSFGFGSFEELKRVMTPRYQWVAEKYWRILEQDQSQDTILRLWNSYRTSYERYIRP